MKNFIFLQCAFQGKLSLSSKFLTFVFTKRRAQEVEGKQSFFLFFSFNCCYTETVLLKSQLKSGMLKSLA